MVFPRRLIDYCSRLRCEHRTLLLWGTRDTIHQAWSDPVLADDCMMRDLPNGDGVWLQGGTHSCILDSAASIAALTQRFLPPSRRPSHPPPLLASLVAAAIGATTRKPVVPMVHRFRGAAAMTRTGGTEDSSDAAAVAKL